MSPAAPPDLVLVVDDDDAVRGVVVRTLLHAGYEVVEAADGAEAEAAVSRMPQPPAVVLTDVAMPAMSGPDLAGRLLRQWPALPVGFMTAFADEDAVKAVTAGFPVLPKPFDVGDLEQFVAYVRDRAPSKRV
jgi:CheY-like chemotaxis protein